MSEELLITTVHHFQVFGSTFEIWNINLLNLRYYYSVWASHVLVWEESFQKCAIVLKKYDIERKIWNEIKDGWWIPIPNVYTSVSRLIIGFHPANERCHYISHWLCTNLESALCLVIKYTIRPWRCSCLVTWFCYHLIAKPGNKTASPSWPDSYYNGYTFFLSIFRWGQYNGHKMLWHIIPPSWTKYSPSVVQTSWWHIPLWLTLTVINWYLYGKYP